MPMNTPTDIKSKKPSANQIAEMFKESKRRKKEHFDWMRKNIDKIPLVN